MSASSLIATKAISAVADHLLRFASFDRMEREHLILNGYQGRYVKYDACGNDDVCVAGSSMRFFCSLTCCLAPLAVHISQ